MMRVIAVADHRFIRGAGRLAASLFKVHPSAKLTLYCDSPAAFAALRSLGDVECVDLPAIRRFGAKRAKFAAYADAIGRGGFLYLDCDVVVLESLDEIVAGDQLAAAPDTLEECPFIADPRHPWPGDPDLRSKVYVNSGVFYFPPQAAAFLQRLAALSEDDRHWQKHIFPGRLFDNHFLCAHLNLSAEPLRALDPRRFNWPGFRHGHELMVHRDGAHLVANQAPHDRLALVHFAGVSDPDDFLRKIDPAVASRIYAAGIDPRLPGESECACFLAACDAPLSALPRDSQPSRQFAAQLSAQMQQPGWGDAGIEATTSGADPDASSPAKRASAPPLLPSEIRHRIECAPVVGNPRPADQFSVPITVHNLSSVNWSSAGEHPVLACYHWSGPDGKVVVFEGLRTPLPRVLPAGASLAMHLQVLAPAAQGLHQLEIDLVQEGVAWFGDHCPEGRAKLAVSIQPFVAEQTADLSRNDLIAWETRHLFFADLSASDLATIRAVQPFTLTTPARIAALLSAVSHLVGTGVPGDFVECGVWRGGSAMAMALRLKELGATDRRLLLCDTFAGMTEPQAVDRNIWNQSAREKFGALRHGEHGSDWARSPLDEVRANLSATGYPPDRVRFVAGKVEDTIPAEAPDRIALLRLDTDWYESTRHELEHLIPRMSRGGIVLIDDYGHWQGARKAVDEFLERLPSRPFLHRIDDSARLWIIG